MTPRLGLSVAASIAALLLVQPGQFQNAAAQIPATRNETFADWAEPNRKGVIYYLNDGKVRGVLLWNVWEKVDAARELIKAGEQVTEKDLRGRIGMGE